MIKELIIYSDKHGEKLGTDSIRSLSKYRAWFIYLFRMASEIMFLAENVIWALMNNSLRNITVNLSFCFL